MKDKITATCKDCLYFHENPKPVYFKRGPGPEYICLEDKPDIDPGSQICEKYEEGFEVAQMSPEL